MRNLHKRDVPQTDGSSSFVTFTELEWVDGGKGPATATRPLILDWLKTFVGTQIQLGTS